MDVIVLPEESQWEYTNICYAKGSELKQELGKNWRVSSWQSSTSYV